MEQIEANRMGTLEIGLNAGSTSYDPRTNLMFMPYLFATWDEARAAIGSKGWLTPIFDDLYSQIGLKVLGIYLNAWDGMAYTKRVDKIAKAPNDYSGIKMRVPPIRIFEVYIPTLGFHLDAHRLLRDIYGPSDRHRRCPLRLSGRRGVCYARCAFLLGGDPRLLRILVFDRQQKALGFAGR